MNKTPVISHDGAPQDLSMMHFSSSTCSYMHDSLTIGRSTHTSAAEHPSLAYLACPELSPTTRKASRPTDQINSINSINSIN